MSQYDDDFWSDGSESTGEFESKGGSFDVIPEGTRCKAHIEEIEWNFYDPEDENIPYVKARWSIESPSDYENRKIFHEIRLYGDDPKGKFYKPEAQETRIDTYRTIFWAIDKNCGGKLAALKRKPKNEELQRYLIGKPMLITLAVWGKPNEKQGNWVRKIEPLNSGNAQQQSKPAPQKQAPKPQPGNVSGGFDDMDDDIPF